MRERLISFEFLYIYRSIFKRMNVEVEYKIVMYYKYLKLYLYSNLIVLDKKLYNKLYKIFCI